MTNQSANLINSIQHIGIPVTNVAASEAFYKRLGFANVMQAPFLEEGQTGTCVMMKNKSIIINCTSYLSINCRKYEIGKTDTSTTSPLMWMILILLLPH